jgi:hypothetical protein
MLFSICLRRNRKSAAPQEAASIIQTRRTALTSGCGFDEMHPGLEVTTMTSWMEERDRLVAQAAAFVQQVAAAHPVKTEVDKAPISVAVGETVEIALPAEPAQAPIRVAIAETATVASAREIKALRPLASERSEIMQRVAAFRARQARLNDERDAYYETMQSKIRGELKLARPGNEGEDSRL